MEHLIAILLCLVSVFTVSYGNVALTYPPARKYNFNFLTVLNSPPPCGIPKGKIFHFFTVDNHVPVQSSNRTVGLLLRRNRREVSLVLDLHSTP
jgi:hypothetical protein